MSYYGHHAKVVRSRNIECDLGIWLGEDDQAMLEVLYELGRGGNITPRDLALMILAKTEAKTLAEAGGRDIVLSIPMPLDPASVMTDDELSTIRHVPTVKITRAMPPKPVEAEDPLKGSW